MTAPAGLGIDIGGTKTAAAVVCADGRVLARAVAPTPAPEGPDAVLAGAAALARQVLAATAATVVGAGVGTAGVVDHHTGSVRFATSSLPGWAGAPVAGRLAAALGLPVVVDNDVNVIAYGEVHIGPPQLRAGTVLFAAVGTGVGGAIVRDGRIDRGATGTAGELAHLVAGPPTGRPCGCGRRGHLEAVAAGPALAAAYGARVGGPAVALPAIADRARCGDLDAIAVIAEGAAALGRVLAGLVTVLDPVAVVLGGGVGEAGPLWWEPMTAAFRAECLPGPDSVVLRPARGGRLAGATGAALLGLHEAVAGRDTPAAGAP